MCLDCETCFEIGTSACPACGGTAWVLLARFLNQEPLKTLSQLHPLAKNWTKGPTRGGDASGAAVKQLIIVAKDRQRLYDHVKRAFLDNPTVEVILDRRRAEPRANRANPNERRRAYDQQRVQTDDHLRALGWAIVRLDVFRSADCRTVTLTNGEPRAWACATQRAVRNETASAVRRFLANAQVTQEIE
jgi:hypothetical protein